jgi:hypothetical protein
MTAGSARPGIDMRSMSKALYLRQTSLSPIALDYL